MLHFCSAPCPTTGGDGDCGDDRQIERVVFRPIEGGMARTLELSRAYCGLFAAAAAAAVAVAALFHNES